MTEPRRRSRKPVDEKSRRKAILDPIVDEIFDLYVSGQSLRKIVLEKQIPMTEGNLREALVWWFPDRWDAAREARSHELIERNVEYAQLAAETGEAAGLKAAADINFKVAALINAKDYGDKKRVELTGANGGAIETKADLTLTPDEAYKRLLKGEA